MLIKLLYALNLLLLTSCLAALRMQERERRLSLSLIQIMAGLPLLTIQYFFSAHHLPNPMVYLLLLHAEGIFALLWLTMAYRMIMATTASAPEPRWLILTSFLIGSSLSAMTIYLWGNPPAIEHFDPVVIATPYGWIYFHALALLLAMLAAAWRLEVFWRTIDPSKRWMYKFFTVGGFLTCAALGWAASYRLTYMRLVPDHLMLLSVLTLLSWILIVFTIARHRLLNRKMFISRKIIYSFVAPTIFSIYLLFLGILSLIIKTYGLTLPYVLHWLALTVGAATLGLFLLSPTLRRRVQFFISTHFYINKYEYRDEWLALSARLQGAASEAKVIQALYEVLRDSFYATTVIIWTGDENHGYGAIVPDPEVSAGPRPPMVSTADPLVRYLKSNPRFYALEKGVGPTHTALKELKAGFLEAFDLVLTAPLHAGDQLVGIVGLGPEFTGGRYGPDDFDLLTALGNQTATAVIAVRMAAKLADAREREAWGRLAAFVLHDIKNAATMLALVTANAPANIHRPEFQKDMLEAIGDALGRMDKVQQRLDMLQEEVAPRWTLLVLQEFLTMHCREIGKRLGDMTIDLQCPPDIQVRTDPQLLSRIIENLLLNTLEACAGSPAVSIAVRVDSTGHQAVLTFTDNGPGIADHLLPDGLFEPLKTTKPRGSGIGLWQVRQLILSLHGSIEAFNTPDDHARFIICLPLHNP